MILQSRQRWEGVRRSNMLEAGLSLEDHWSAFLEAQELGPSVAAYEKIRAAALLPDASFGRTSFDGVHEAMRAAGLISSAPLLDLLLYKPNPTQPNPSEPNLDPPRHLKPTMPSCFLFSLASSPFPTNTQVCPTSS